MSKKRRLRKCPGCGRPFSEWFKVDGRWCYCYLCAGSARGTTWTEDGKRYDTTVRPWRKIQPDAERAAATRKDGE